MKLARERLHDPQTTLAQVATEVGYGNEYAFSAAFKRHTGDPPGRWRTHAANRSQANPAPESSADAG
jgi:AraC-like DNA-binding protein